MDTVTYPDPRVATFIAQHCVPVKIAIKQNRRLAEDYLVSWTPNVIFADGQRRVHYRIEGYLPPELFVAYLSLGVGKYLLDHQNFDAAAERFDEVAQRHQGTDAGAQGLYWLGVARYRKAHDAAQLGPSWQRLAQEYPHSDWTRRTQIPAKG